MENNPQSNQEVTRLNEVQIDYISEFASRKMHGDNFRIDEQTGVMCISCGGIPPLDMLDKNTPTIPEVHDGISFRGFEVSTYYGRGDFGVDDTKDLEIFIDIPKKVFDLVVKFQKNKQEFSQLYSITDLDSRNILIENSPSNQEATRLILNKKIWEGLCYLPVNQGETLEDIVKKNKKDDEALK
jgi:hypothetical protein